MRQKPSNQMRRMKTFTVTVSRSLQNILMCVFILNVRLLPHAAPPAHYSVVVVVLNGYLVCTVIF